MEGEVWMLDGSHSVFGPAPPDPALAERLAAFDIHPTGALWGAGEPRTGGAARALEADVAARLADGRVADGLVRAGLKQERRALRVVPRDLAWEWLQPDALRLGFSLPAGSYATAVLHELGAVRDARA
jgi:tRNA pseudouridine13 synthase